MVNGHSFKLKVKIMVRATPMGVAIRGAIPITAKMAPQQLKIMLQRRCHQRWQNAIPGFGVPYLATLEREMSGCKMAVSNYCYSQ